MKKDEIAQQARKFRDQAWTLRSEHAYAQALKSYESALMLFQRLKDDAYQCSILMEIGDTTLCMGDFATARHYYEQGQAVFNMDEIPFIYAYRLLDGLKTISLKEQNFAQAFEELLQLLALYQGSRDPERNTTPERISTCHQLGNVAAQLGQAVISDDYFALALNLAERDLVQSARILWDWGVAHTQRGQYDEGCRFCQQAIFQAELAAETLANDLPSHVMSEARIQQYWDEHAALRQKFDDLNAQTPSLRETG